MNLKISGINNSMQSSRTSFKSINCPVSPFTITTAQGTLSIKEMQRKDLNKTVSFFLKVLPESVKSWEGLKNASTWEKQYYTKHLRSWLTHCIKKEDGNSTVLIAKDEKEKVKALADLQYFDEIDALIHDGFKDLQTGHIQNCYISPEYRGQGLGKILLDKLLGTAEGHFTDIFLCSERPSINFYEKSGFSKMDGTDPVMKKVINYILSVRASQDTVIPMSKALDARSPWWLRMAELIK